MRVFFDTVGCRLNQSEIDSLALRFHATGDEIVARPAQAEVIVLNTCAVTREAERDSRSAARRLHALAPQARLVLTGCWATLAAGEARALPGVSRVVANAGKAALRESLAGAQRDAPMAARRPPLRAGARTPSLKCKTAATTAAPSASRGRLRLAPRASRPGEPHSPHPPGRA